jgi:hypothetical protein
MYLQKVISQKLRKKLIFCWHLVLVACESRGRTKLYDWLCVWLARAVQQRIHDLNQEMEARISVAIEAVEADMR